MENRLASARDPGNVPGLQGQPTRRLSGQQWDVMQVHWSPGTRLLMGAAGGAMAAFGAGRRDTLGGALTLDRLNPVDTCPHQYGAQAHARCGGRQTRHRHSEDHQPLCLCRSGLRLWANYQNFPRFMSNVREVKDLDDGRSHWIVAGPAGTSVEWDAVITSYSANEVLAWRTEPNSLVQHAGIIHFRSNPDGSTTVNIRLTYNPAVWGLGHIVASLFGADPKSQMDEDLVRMKSFIETGKVPSDAAWQMLKALTLAEHSTQAPASVTEVTERLPRAGTGRRTGGADDRDRRGTAVGQWHHRPLRRRLQRLTGAAAPDC